MANNIKNLIEKLQKSAQLNDIIEKAENLIAIENLIDTLQKGKRAVIGEQRTWKYGTFIKHPDGWVRVQSDNKLHKDKNKNIEITPAKQAEIDEEKVIAEIKSKIKEGPKPLSDNEKLNFDPTNIDKAVLSKADFTALDLMRSNNINPLDNVNDFYEKIKGVKSKVELKSICATRIFMKTGVRIQGNWDKRNAVVLKNFENLVTKLPKGHVLHNTNIKNFQNHLYSSVSGFAFFHKPTNTISLSHKCVNKAKLKGNLAAETAFNHTIGHEIGHSVSNKLRSVNPKAYYDIAKEAGWEKLSAKIQATGKEEDVPRENTRPKLLRDYSYTSAEENFADIYSSYIMNKKEIDLTLDSDGYNILIIGPEGRTIQTSGYTLRMYSILRKAVFENPKMIKSLTEDGLL